MAKIAFLGLGAMGSRMARNLIAAGHELTVWNRDPQKAEALRDTGADAALTPRAAVADSDFVFSMLRDDAASRYVWLEARDGALGGLPDGAIAVDCSTLSVNWVQELAELCRRRNIVFIDAPVVGSRPQADARQLIFLAGGVAEAVSRTEAVLLHMGASVLHAGPNGAGAAAKLAVNTLFGIQVAVLAELIEAVRHRGFDPARLVELVSATPVCSPAAKAAAGAMLLDTFPPLFPIQIVEKDLGYALSIAETVDSTPLASAARNVFARAINAGHGADNITGVVRLYRQS
ncbi:NAD(P)-dependent oxidoreductase [Bosea vaviloviae]|uniref:3-hydroxyisobutyrate dehydrogenase n=1 Tax=Bosea vaviloviae TaxID=1526658 RepID=A0A0N1FDS3_9HYPH|nr:NAD(P)-dependent oxidoreductase [Bosea vaviloviae]KPH77386.1 3-hydroxyisobutyrate dehydrogenase [Bosea vaviloviae]